jgi:uncharacterized protein YycO
MRLMLYKVWTKLLTWFGDLYIAFRIPLIKAKNIRRMMEVIKKGDVLLRRYDAYIDNYFIIKEKYTHSGIVVSDKLAVHSISEGVEYIDIIDFIKDCDGFVILRPNYNNKKDIEKVVTKAKSLIGTEYDFLFNNDTSKLYCHELTNFCLAQVEMDVVPKKRRFFWVKKIVVIDGDFLDKFEVVYETYNKSRKVFN